MTRAVKAACEHALSGAADTDSSDIDVMVDLEPDVSIVQLIGLQRQMSEVLGRPVDLVSACALEPSIRARTPSESIAL